MRILHVGKFFPPFAGGIENFMADLLPAQAAQGDTVAALVHAHQPPGWSLWPSIASEPWPWGALYRAPCFGRWLYTPISPHFPVWLHRVIHEFQPDALHLHLPNPSAFWALPLPSARRLPWIIHWHSDVVASALDQRLALAYRVYRPFEQAVLQRACAIIATSPPYLESSPALAPWRGKCHTVSLGLDAARLPPASAAALAWANAMWEAQPGARILNVGRMTYYKGQEILLRALAQLPQAQGIIVGEGEWRPQLEQCARTLQLGQRARLLGFVAQEQLAALLQTCDIFCLPSLERTEAFGMVLLEAMRHGRAVVASRIPGSGVGWVTQEGQTGLLVPPADPVALANALHHLITDVALRQRLGQAGATRFFQELTIAQVAAQIRALYCKI